MKRKRTSKKQAKKQMKTSSPGGEELTFDRATASYEAWMRDCTEVVSSDLRLKHEQMKQDPFLFLRGTFYRWAQQWPSVCAEVCAAPKLLPAGELRVNTFATW